MKIGGLIGNDLRTNRLGFGRDRVKGQGQGREKVKNNFWRYLRQFLSDRHETNAKMCGIALGSVCTSQSHVTRSAHAQ